MALPSVVGFIDMDCFYVAVERTRDPRLNGIPCAVVQYNTNDRGSPDLPADANRWRTGGAMGGIIAVSYEARARGVTRQMLGKDALKVCPEIVLVQVPTAFGKADLRIYKTAGDDVVALLAKRADATEKRSVDEVAIDITSEAERLLAERDWESDLFPAAQKSAHLADSDLSRQAAHVSRDDTRKGHDGQQEREIVDASGGWEDILRNDSADPVTRRLVAGAVVVAELRAEVKATLGFTCSGGVATNKLLAKLGCGLHKPDQQTILLPRAVPLLLQDLPLDRLPGLGGDLGGAVKSRLGVETAGQLVAKGREEVRAQFPEKGDWLFSLASGLDAAADSVKDRQLVKSLSNGKTFFQQRLSTAAEVEKWIDGLAGELHRRYQEQVEHHQRTPTTIGVHISVGGGRGKGMKGSSESFSKQQSIDLGRAGTVEQIAAGGKACFHRWISSSFRNPPLGVTSLGLSLTGMISLEASNATLAQLFSKSAPKASATVPAPTAVEVAAWRMVMDPDLKARGNNAPAASATVPAPAAVEGGEASRAKRQKFSTGSFLGGGAAQAQTPGPPKEAQPAPDGLAGRKVSRISAALFANAAAPVVARAPGEPVLWRPPVLDASQVDEAILAELPASIQREIREQLRLSAGPVVGISAKPPHGEVVDIDE